MVTETVDEFLIGSKIVEQDEYEGSIYAIAMLTRERTLGDIDKSVAKTRDSIKKVQEERKGRHD